MLRRAFLILFCLLFSAAVFGAQEVLHLGIAPFNAPGTLFKTHQSLQKHLEERLGRPVRFHTSANHLAFLADCLNDRFDIIITPPHFGALFLEYDYTPLVRYQAPMSTIFIVRAASGFKTLADLRGKRVAFPERASFFYVAGIREMEENGMYAGRDYLMQERPNHAAAIIAVSLKEVDAAFSTQAVLNQMPTDVRAQLRSIHIENEAEMPHLMTLARAQLGPDLIAKIKSALNSFASTDGGKAFFLSTGYEGYAPITEKDIKMARPYTALIRSFVPPKSGGAVP
ncbi:putative selenate ABC transporter substrate-binding protein [Betaproteobacteria bacterium]|nr:putative selenate ABC transporter substrate-binding protein [Betaproteobacteria bacterium]GHU42874.1 putative selenate ABC transporter substrate-binding protein [Betaproteobacteria bacterium]